MPLFANRRRANALATGLAIALCLVACSPATAPMTHEEAMTAAFDDFWTTFDRTYPYFDHKRVDWAAIRAEQRPRAAMAQTDSDLLDVLRAAATPLRDAHIWFDGPGGTRITTYVPPGPPNWSRTLIDTYDAEIGWVKRTQSWGYGKRGGVGYIFVGTWNTTTVSASDLDAALNDLADTHALIVDVRPNGGGNDALAFSFAGRFTSRVISAGTVTYRAGPGHADFGSPVSLTVTPRAPQYKGSVFVLVGRSCFSSNEEFIAAMNEMPNVVTIGDTTGGGSGNPTMIELKVNRRATGWSYSVPRWIQRTNSGAIVEWNGIPPRVVIPFDARASGVSRDPVLDSALAAARNAAAGAVAQRGGKRRGASARNADATAA